MEFCYVKVKVFLPFCLNRKRENNGGRSLANKETAFAYFIGQNKVGWSKQNRMLGGRGSELRCHAPLSQPDTRKLMIMALGFVSTLCRHAPQQLALSFSLISFHQLLITRLILPCVTTLFISYLNVFFSLNTGFNSIPLPGAPIHLEFSTSFIF